MSRATVSRLAVLACTGAVVLPLVATAAVADPGPAQPRPQDAVEVVNGRITFFGVDRREVYTVNPDGSGRQLLYRENGINTHTTIPVWAPDGSRYAFPRAADALVSKRLDGSGQVTLAPAANLPHDPAWSPDGSYLVYSLAGRLRFTGADGGWWTGELMPPAGGTHQDEAPTIAPDGTVVFERVNGTQRDLWAYEPDASQPTPLIPSSATASVSRPAFSPDGARLAYQATDPQTGVSQIWLSDADGGNQVQLTTEGDRGATSPAWAPDGTSIAFVVEPLSGSATVNTVDVATGVVTPVAADAGYGVNFSVSWQPVRTNGVDRVWGQDHIDTAIAASQGNFADYGDPSPPAGLWPAGAAVLSRDDTYYDALVGSAFAIKEDAPLLVTRRTALDARVEREIRRILGTSGQVYLLGGELALAPAVADRLTDIGYSVTRIWGQTHFDTAIAINNRITTNPGMAIITTGTNFYDALAAGAAAGANPGTVIVLTSGSQLPTASATYLNRLSPDPDTGTTMVTAGGPGNRAFLDAYTSNRMPSWPDRIFYWPLVGANEKDTAVQIAEFFFAAPYLAAVATNRTWFDALTGGAMIGANYGPLLITDRTGLYPAVRNYLSTNSGNMWSTVMLGGPAALPDALIAPLGDAISLPGEWEYSSIQPTQGPTAPPMAGRTGPDRVASPDRNRSAEPPGVAEQPATATR